MNNEILVVFQYEKWFFYQAIWFKAILLKFFCEFWRRFLILLIKTIIALKLSHDSTSTCKKLVPNFWPRNSWLNSAFFGTMNKFINLSQFQKTFAVAKHQKTIYESTWDHNMIMTLLFVGKQTAHRQKLLEEWNDQRLWNRVFTLKTYMYWINRFFKR